MLDVIRVIHGAYEGDFELVGRTVGELKKALAYALHIPADAIAFVSGREASDNLSLKPGDSVEFLKKAKRSKSDCRPSVDRRRRGQGRSA